MDNTNFQTIHQMGNAINNVVRQAMGRDAVQNIDMDYVTVAQRKRAIEGTVTGNPASFITNNTDPLKSLLCNLAPVQDLHGYDHPWVGGAGKNLSPVTVENIKSASTDLTWNGNAGSQNGITATIETDSDGNVTGIDINGTSTDTFVLYLYDLSTCFLNQGTTYRMNGLWAVGTGSTFKHDIIYGSSMSFVDLTPILGTTFEVSSSFVSAGRYRERLVIYSGQSFDHVKFYPMILLYTDPADTYEPYTNICTISGWTGCNAMQSGEDMSNPTIYPVTWQTEAGIVLGGTFDFASGTLTINKRVLTLTGVNDWLSVSGNKFYVAINDMLEGDFTHTTTYEEQQCNMYLFGGMTNEGSIAVTTNKRVYLQRSAPTPQYNRVWVYDTTHDIDTFKAMLNEKPLQITYPIVEQTIQLPKVDILTSIGTNNIWSDTGDVTVKYTIYEEVI